MNGYEKKDMVIWDFVVTELFSDIGTFNYGHQLWDALASACGDLTIDSALEEIDPTITLVNEDLSELTLESFFKDYMWPSFERLKNFIQKYNKR